MTTPPVAPASPPRKWYGLALRNLRISQRLLRTGFPDAAFFHCYHAYECGLSAVITAKGFSTPPLGQKGKSKKGTYYASPKGGFYAFSPHKAKDLLFQSVATVGQPYYSSYSNLTRYLSVQSRNDSLYYDERNNTLPADRHQPPNVVSLSKAIHRFLGELRVEIT